MKITLIEPKAPGKHVYSNVTMPRLGLPILGTLLQKAGHQVRLIMGSSRDIHLSEITGADLICISTTTSTAVEAYHLGDFARDQGKPVIMGGAHVSFMSEEALDHCDYVCRGEADLTFMPLISCIERGELPSDIPGVSFRQGEQIVHNPDADWVDFNSVPFPDLSLFSGLKMTTYPVMTSRGCPYDCTFCSVTKMFGRKFRYRETEALLEELKQYRGKQVFFVDDNFSANTRRTKELLREMIRQDIKPSWWCTQVRTDAARDDELLQLMYDSNCRMVFVGMESVNPETLKSYNKKQDVEDIEYCIQRFHNLGIMVHGMFVFGADEDSLQTIEETLDFALKNRIDTVQFLILTPLPGTKTFFDLEQEGRLLTRDWNLYDAHHVVFQPRQMSPYELQTATIQAFKKFYSIPNILKNLFTTGFRSVAFRALGFWMVRSWERENRWFYSFLRSLSSPVPQTTWRAMVSKTVERFRLRKLKYLCSEKFMQIEVFQEKGRYVIDLKGLLNDFSLRETFKTLYEQIPRLYQNITINIGEVYFTSEATIVKFVNNLNELTSKARDIQVKISPDNKNLIDVLRKYDMTVPGFSIVG
ncbi:B12-binding domain-containing radical SAM protein [Syntrophaceticus schinkii]|jgi:anaerobic magnesium-protoporphyrin IX monomethyl ester cyclase|uniref:Radical SAM domain protein n=1 Tax=Syntrophaceticus schinkii TaxID=499207 RepID=A0A0B7MEU2_9FIRM|nr:radical SAM protein [Syntrophaceticus schinkii]CEO88600.1 Radical SAM domain protein [Syntrophaceticus schinkii]